MLFVGPRLNGRFQRAKAVRIGFPTRDDGNGSDIARLEFGGG